MSPRPSARVAGLALSNGIAIEQLADPENVDPSIFGVILNLLLHGQGVPAASQTQ